MPISPRSYIKGLSQRIDVYKKIAAIQNKDDAFDVTDELIDRFGDPPGAVQGLIDVALVRGRAAALASGRSPSGIRVCSSIPSGWI